MTRTSDETASTSIEREWEHGICVICYPDASIWEPGTRYVTICGVQALSPERFESDLDAVPANACPFCYDAIMNPNGRCSRGHA